MTPTDRYYLSRAALSGDACTMERTSSALAAIAQCLQDDATLANAFRRDGLLTAIDIIAGELADRADFLREMAEEEGDDV